MEEEIDRLSTFFQTDLNYPDIEKTLGTPKLHGDNYSKIKLNPLIPVGTKHESRHSAHRNIIEEVIEGQEEQVMDFYENELRNIETDNTFYNTITSLTTKMPGLEATDQIYDRQDSWGYQDLADILFSKNSETDLQPEVFAHNSKTEPMAVFGGASAVLGYNVVNEPEIYRNIVESTSQFPEATLITAASIPMAYLLGKDSYNIGTSEELTEENLESYGLSDRRRAMLYNSNVENNIEDFLSKLDDYEIQ